MKSYFLIINLNSKYSPYYRARGSTEKINQARQYVSKVSANIALKRLMLQDVKKEYEYVIAKMKIQLVFDNREDEAKFLKNLI